MKKMLVPVVVVAIALLTGCTSTKTTIHDPATHQTGGREVDKVSAEEFRTAAQKAINDALTNEIFQDFLKKYKDDKKDQSARPLMKLTQVKNDTNDTSLNIAGMTDLLKQSLINSRVVRVTLAEGADLQTAIAASRAIAQDPNFNKATVPKEGTLEAADIVLCPKVISDETRDGRKQNVVRTFVLEMANVHTGEVIWMWQTQLAFTKEKSIFGF